MFFRASCHSWIGDLARDTTWGGNDGGVCALRRALHPGRAQCASPALLLAAAVPPASKRASQAKWLAKEENRHYHRVPPRSPGCRPGGRPILATANAKPGAGRAASPPVTAAPVPLPASMPSRSRPRPCPPRRSLVTRRTPPRTQPLQEPLGTVTRSLPATVTRSLDCATRCSDWLNRPSVGQCVTRGHRRRPDPAGTTGPRHPRRRA